MDKYDIPVYFIFVLSREFTDMKGLFGSTRERGGEGRGF
jgi:hypothetical protein